MSDIDLREFPANEFVLHFGGRPNEINAFTFSNALIGFAEAIQEINRQTRPEMAVEVMIDGVGPGSFRAKIRAITKTLSGLFKGEGLSGQILAGVLATLIYEKVLEPRHPDQITITAQTVIITNGDNRIIIPRNIWDAKERLHDQARVDRYIAKAFTAIEEDPSVTDFGIVGNMDDPSAGGVVTRDMFHKLTAPPKEEEEGKRASDQIAHLQILKAVFERGNRKWEFVWNGLKIPAVITDSTFFDRLASRQIWFAQGDTLDVILRIHQKYDDLNKIYINETYEIVSVTDVVHREAQQRLQ